MIGGGCSCGVGGVAVAPCAFEQGIVALVQAEAQRNARSDVLALLEATARDAERWSLLALLAHLPGSPATFDADPAGFILERLTGALHSFDKLHAGR